MEAASPLERERRMEVEECPPVMRGGTFRWFWFCPVILNWLVVRRDLSFNDYLSARD